MSLEVCPKCQIEALETVDESPDLELEIEYGHPVTRIVKVCLYCGYEEITTKDEFE